MTYFETEAACGDRFIVYGGSQIMPGRLIAECGTEQDAKMIVASLRLHSRSDRPPVDGIGRCECGSRNLDHDPVENAGPGSFIQVALCLDCGSSWTDVYTFDRRDDLQLSAKAERILHEDAEQDRGDDES